MARVTDLTLGGRVEGGVEHHDLVQPEVAVLSPEQLAGVLGLAGSTEQEEEEEEREIVGPHHDSVASMTRSGPLREGLGDLYHSTHQSHHNQLSSQHQRRAARQRKYYLLPRQLTCLSSPLQTLSDS